MEDLATSRHGIYGRTDKLRANLMQSRHLIGRSNCALKRPLAMGLLYQQLLSAAETLKIPLASAIEYKILAKLEHWGTKTDLKTNYRASLRKLQLLE